MPWAIRKNAGKCGGSKPWAVVKKADGKVVGCHETQEKAKKQIAALNIHVHREPEGGDSYKLASYTYISDLPPQVKNVLSVSQQQSWLTAYLEEMGTSGDEKKAEKAAWAAVGKIVKVPSVSDTTSKTEKTVIVNMSEQHYGFWHDLSQVNLDEGWMQLVPYGDYDHPLYGTLTFDNDVLTEMDKNFKDGVRGTDIDIDYDHKMDASKGRKAAGWLKETDLREDGLWGLVDFTDEATEEIKAKEWRYFSPEVAKTWKHPKTKKSYSNVLCGGGLTNRPHLKDIQPVNLSELPEELFDEDTPRDGRALTQEEVNYRDAPDDALQCANCSRFIKPDGCRKVSGSIRADGVCDIFSNDLYYWSERGGVKMAGEEPEKLVEPPKEKEKEKVAEPPAAQTFTEADVQRMFAENKQMREDLGILQRTNRLSEINTQLSDLATIPPAAHDDLREVMQSIPRELSDKLVKALSTINETGTITLGESGATRRREETESTEGDAVKRFTNEIAARQAKDANLSYDKAAELVAMEKPQMFNEYVEASYLKR